MTCLLYTSMDAAACIGCGACVAACKNGSAMLFVSAKVSQLALLPQEMCIRDSLAEVSNAIIDQCVAQGVPFAREYGGLLDNRSFGGAQVSRTFYARGQTGQQLLLGAYSALSREVQRGNVKLYTRYEMLDVVLIKDCLLYTSRCV